MVSIIKICEETKRRRGDSEKSIKTFRESKQTIYP